MKVAPNDDHEGQVPIDVRCACEKERGQREVEDARDLDLTNVKRGPGWDRPEEPAWRDHSGKAEQIRQPV